MTSLRVLLAEDLPLNQRRFTLQLQKLGCSVHLATTGWEALAAVETQSFDVLLIDSEMPEMAGWEAIPQIAGQTPLVALVLNDQDESRCLAAGALSCLRKPLQQSDLDRVIQALGPGSQAAS